MAAKTFSENEEAVIVALFLVSSVVYFSSTVGVSTSNAGSHYALVKAIAEERTFTIDSFAMYTGYVDYSRFNDRLYSDRAPGMAFATAPFYLAGKVLSSFIPMPSYYSGFNQGNPSVFTSLLMPVLAGGLCVVLAYLVCRELGAGIYGSSVAAITLAFGTILWKYSGTLFSHSLSEFLMLLSLYLALTLKDFRRQYMRSCVLFFALGYMVLTEYANVLLTAIMLIYILSTKKMTLREMLSPKIHLLCLAAPILAIAAYNQINFGNPFTTAYNFAPQHPWVGKLGESLTTPLLVGLRGLLLTAPGIDGGLFVTTPVLIFAVWGFTYLHKDRRNEALLIASLFAAHLLFYSKFRTWNGGAVEDTRYILTVTPMLVIPLSAWVEGFLLKRKTQGERTLYEALMWSLLILSVLNIAYDVATFEGHGIMEFTFPVLNTLELRTSLNTIFPNIIRLPVFTGIMCVLYGLASIALKRTPGLWFDSSDKTTFNLAVGVLIVVGLLTVIASSRLPLDSVSIYSWEYSSDSFEWQKGEPPFKSDSPIMLVRAILNVNKPVEEIIVNVAAVDCIDRVQVNDRTLYAGNKTKCKRCLHCNGLKLNLQGIPGGQNRLMLKIDGVGNTTRFSLTP
ncbi:MAG: hypothetical protein V1744_05145 [Candidatus Altiarchaeota archaeon]